MVSRCQELAMLHSAAAASPRWSGVVETNRERGIVIGRRLRQTTVFFDNCAHRRQPLPGGGCRYSRIFHFLLGDPFPEAVGAEQKSIAGLDCGWNFGHFS